MLNELFQQLGHKPTATTPTQTTYKSPWNTNEKTASCFVFKNKYWDNVDPLKEFNFKDHSSDYGGDAIKFIRYYFNIGYVEALGKITELTGQNHTPQHAQPQQETKASFSFNQPKEESYKIIKTKQLQNKALVDYLKEDRGLVSIDLKRYVSEVYYEIEDKQYFAVSFVNDIGGREVRNKYFKGSLGKKDISTVFPNPKDRRVKIFEGFMDFLSYLQLNENVPLSNYLILNGTGHKKKGLKAVQGKFEAFELYLDNGRGGNEATEYFLSNLNNAVDKRVHYSEHDDLNEFLLNR